MSTMFAGFDIARSGMGTYKLWLDAVADNVANMNNISRTDEPAFQERFIMVESAEGGGVRVRGSVFGDPNGRLQWHPNNPLADEEGMVRVSAVDLSEQMVYLQIAQRGYQANIRTFERAREAYEAALGIGR